MISADLIKWGLQPLPLVFFLNLLTNSWSCIIYEHFKYFCNPLKSNIPRFPNVTSLEKRFLNSGAYIGYVQDVYAIIHHIVDVMKVTPGEDDQKDFQEIFLGTNHFPVI